MITNHSPRVRQNRMGGTRFDAEKTLESKKRRYQVFKYSLPMRSTCLCNCDISRVLTPNEVTEESKLYYITSISFFYISFLERKS